MGYGHLRAAHALAEALGTEVVLADRPPLVDADELLSRGSPRSRWSAGRCARCSTR
jgi:hypothetical protein